MNDSPAVSPIQCICDLNAKFDDLLYRHRFLSNAVLQRLAIEELHHDEWAAFIFSNVVHSANVRMIQCRRSFRLSFKPLQALLIAREFFWQELERDETSEAH